MDIEMRNFLISILVGIFTSWALLLIPIWQLIILAGILAGVLNSTLKKGILAGAIAVGLFWLIYMIIGFVSINAYTMLDQFGGLLIGSGFGWLIFIIVLLMGILFGALGGGIGSAMMMLVRERSETDKNDT
ncbi:MAG: membrane protein of unknown function [Promethearchaeota archaeon]|nr:MAG: membrane protein of unknown function [Candidatus Lokiarchaeota archaeon]